MDNAPIHADHVTYHHHAGPETRSEAVANYAGAACSVGLAVMLIGVGIGFIRGGFTKKSEPKPSGPAKS